MRIIISAPIYKRDWILPAWFEAIEKQTFPLSDIGFIFELGPDDDATHECLWNWHSKHPEVWCFDGVVRVDEVHTTHPEGARVWRGSDYYRMIQFRNSILDRAVCLSPDRLFSLDSDILLEDPTTIEQLITLTETRDAVSPFCYMTPHTQDYPNVMSWTDRVGGRATRIPERYPIGQVFKVDVIMAAVMMTKPVYEKVRYRWHRQGEDLGWSSECAYQGFHLYSASNILVNHVMHRYLLP